MSGGQVVTSEVMEHKADFEILYVIHYAGAGDVHTAPDFAVILTRLDLRMSCRCSLTEG